MKNNNKQIMYSMIGIALLLIGVVGLSYAFFNYTRTGQANTLKTGNISFNSTQDNTISLTNVFPTSSTNLNSTNSDTVTINITGDTDYSEGIEYKVTLDQVNNTINGKEVPISFNVTASDLGTKDSSYYTNRGGATPIYNLTEKGQVEDGKYILVGYIPSGSTGVNGSIDITAFIDGDRVAISDTVSRIENGNLIYGETPGDWIVGRTVLTTTEWNSFNSNSISFKVKVEANEGIWVEEETYFVMKNLYSDSNWTGIRANITSIEFHKDGVAPKNYITSFDVTDVTSAGPVTLYTIDDGFGNDTYKAIVVADDVIYAPDNSQRMFRYMSKLVTFNSNNFKVDNVSNMMQIFDNCASLVNIDSLSTWNTSNVSGTGMMAMFMGCSNLVNVNGLVNLDTSNVTQMYYLFKGCTNLNNIDGLVNWDTSNVTSMGFMFEGCSNLTNIDALSNWNTSNVIAMQQLFLECANLSNLDGLKKWNVEKVENMSMMFKGCINIEEIDLSGWITTSLNNMAQMFGMFNSDGTQRFDSKLKKIILSDKFDTSKVTDMYAVFANNTLLEEIASLLYFDTKNVLDMASMFQNCESLKNISGLAKWNVENVTDMSNLFRNCINLTDISALSSWNVSNVTKMYYMFGIGGNDRSSKTGDPVIDFSPLANWNVSNVTNMMSMFLNVNIKSYNVFINWNVGKVQDFNNMFNATSASTVTTLTGLENWDVSSATNMEGMFADNFSLTDASAINNWNINSSINFTNMFVHTPVHPEFTQVQGTWDSGGTFTPNA